jgi:hypothetical protein
MCGTQSPSGAGENAVRVADSLRGRDAVRVADSHGLRGRFSLRGRDKGDSMTSRLWQTEGVSETGKVDRVQDRGQRRDRDDRHNGRKCGRMRRWRGSQGSG